MWIPSLRCGIPQGTSRLGAFTETMTDTVPPLPHTPRRRRRPYVRLTLAGLLAATLAVAGLSYCMQDQHSSGTGTSAVTSPHTSIGSDPGYDQGGGGSDSWGDLQPQGGNGQSPGSVSGTSDASAAQSVGVVDIDTTLSGGDRAAGTGMILTSGGKVLTNNHVVAGSTSIKVTVVSTGDRYTARIVGTDSTHDVAVLDLQDASGLSTVQTNTSGDVAIGDDVTGVGNAGGDGGAPSAAPGSVTALDQSVTTEAEATSAGETLDGMIKIDADIQAGDSGGPLYDGGGKVIGMDTAASTGTAEVVGFAIPIEDALQVADRIESGAHGTRSGYPAFLGVELATGSGTATIAGVVDGSGAADAGLRAGQTITSIDGTQVGSASALADAISRHQPGDRISLEWTDGSGQSQSSTVTLGEGPAA